MEILFRCPESQIHHLLPTNPSDLNQIRSMRSFALITSNTKSGRLSRSSYIKATQSSRCCGVVSIMLHFVQTKLNFLSPRENLRVFKCPDDKRAKAVCNQLDQVQESARPQKIQNCRRTIHGEGGESLAAVGTRPWTPEGRSLTLSIAFML
ncbi:hypothetical protein AVEN_253300-1 [Araneus ventricosus]|uniref:Uncharacterized protein n=1 Tax=Araneus ventricosus TaxID=182803 RepID=A0A4Y2LNH4_ARAVE|nr:hypothetical protein AVEN_253300-1 [Araneus ventricosus]